MFSSLDFLIPLPAFDAVPLELFLPLDFFLGQLRCGKLKLPDKAKVDIHFLHPVAVNFFRGVDDDFLHELVDHGRGQLGKIRVLLCQLQKLLGPVGVLRKGRHLRFHFRDGCCQRFLLRLIFRQQAVEPLAGNAPDGKGFIELLDDGIQLRNPLFLLVQLPLGFLGGFRLAQLGGGAYLLQKSVSVGDGKGAGSPDGFQNQLPQRFGADMMSTASGGALLTCQLVCGAFKRIVGIRFAFCPS